MIFWICDENSLENRGVFILLLSRVYTASRLFLFLNPSHQRGGWGCPRRLGVPKEVGGRHSQDSDPN